ncbi:tRNA-dihydrouridine synthase, partial [Candidatus Peregrinibacteria bacterium]|nr:tRNA-dihydrouridine synthase [Candidatus Peregrinibacteria bacterium]
LKNGLCSALIEDHARAAEIIAAVKEGARCGDGSWPRRVTLRCEASGRATNGRPAGHLTMTPQLPFSIPLSVKTRIGIKKPVTEDWIGFLLEQGLDAITIHARTVKDMSKAPARWGEIAKAVKLRDSMGKGTVIIGNGDVTSRAQALAYAEEYGVDGVMIGRGIFQNLWLFHPEKCDRQIPLTEKLRVLRRHVELYRDMWGETRSFEILKKFIKVYISGFPGAAEMRKEFMSTQSYAELLELTHSSMATGIPTN